MKAAGGTLSGAVITFISSRRKYFYEKYTITRRPGWPAQVATAGEIAEFPLNTNPRLYGKNIDLTVFYID